MSKLITVLAILFAGCCAATKTTKAQNPVVNDAHSHDARHGVKTQKTRPKASG